MMASNSKVSCCTSFSGAIGFSCAKRFPKTLKQSSSVIKFFFDINLVSVKKITLCLPKFSKIKRSSGDHCHYTQNITAHLLLAPFWRVRGTTLDVFCKAFKGHGLGTHCNYSSSQCCCLSCLGCEFSSRSRKYYSHQNRISRAPAMVPTLDREYSTATRRCSTKTFAAKIGCLCTREFFSSRCA